MPGPAPGEVLAQSSSTTVPPTLPLPLSQLEDEADGLVAWLRENHLLVPVQILLILVGALILDLLARRVIDRAVRGLHDIRALPGTGDAARDEQRVRTIRSVLKGAARFVIWGLALLLVLQALGYAVTQLVFSVSVITAALTFGAQQLIRDLIAGSFVLMEDQYGVGDTVDLGHATGTVERITLRATRVRDVHGTLWTVPNGQVVRAGNLSREWSRAVLDVPVAADADLEACRQVLTDAAQGLGALPQLAADVAGPFEVTGVQDLGDDRAVLRVSVRTRPGRQFAVLLALRTAVAEARRDGRLPVPVGPAEP